MVGRDVGLAFGAVDDEAVDLAQRRLDLGVGGEGGAAHARDAGAAHDVDDLLGGGLGQLAVVGGDGRIEGHLAVVFNDDIHDGLGVGVVAGVDGHDLARHAGVDGTSQAGLNIADDLAAPDMVADRHQRLAVRADVLGQGDGDLRRCGHALDLLTLGVLVLRHMGAAAECICQMDHLSESKFSIYYTSFPGRMQAEFRTKCGYARSFAAAKPKNAFFSLPSRIFMQNPH